MRHLVRNSLLISLAVALVILGVLLYSKDKSASVIYQDTQTYTSVVPFIPQDINESEIKILFVGDMSFDRNIRKMIDLHRSDYVFSCIDPLLQEADFVVGNLEGPITENKSVSLGSIVGSPENYRFTFPTTTAELLFKHNIKLVNIGNNHVNDFGLEGVSSTQAYLTDARVSYFGGIEGNNPVYRMSHGDKQLSFISYNQFGGDSPEKTAEMIVEEKKMGNIVIVYTHWGEEYITPTKQVRSTAHLFAQNGANLIVGSHPHVIQEHEIIGDTSVYYSLGNFIFDQYFNADVTQGLALLVHISEDGMTIHEKKVSIHRDGRTCPSNVVSI